MKIIIPGKPIPLKRPEVRFFSGRAIGYDPSYKDKVEARKQLITQIKKDNIIYDCPIKMNIIAYMPIPKSLSQKKQKELIGTPHIKRPDLDNIIKFYLDLLEGYAYNRDENICDLNGSKVYDINARVEIIYEKIQSN